MAEAREIKLTLDPEAVKKAIQGILTPGSTAVVLERRRQIEVEGYTPEHDKGHEAELVAAARCYADLAMYQLKYANDPSITIGDVLASVVPYHWPWAPEEWKPSADPDTNILKASALLTAALDARLAAQA